MSGLFLRTRVLPWVAWFAVMGAAAWLWRGSVQGAARGFAESTTYTVSTLQPGRIATLAVVPGQRVRAGDVIATLDDREVAAELEILAAEARRLEAELGAVASETQVRIGETSREIEESIEAAERALQAARADRGVRAAELAAMTSQVDVLQQLVAKQMADRRELDALAVQHAALKKELQTADGLVSQLVSQVAAARARRGGLPPDATDRATEPLRAELAVIRQREELLALRKEALVLRAPGDGEVTALHLRAGEVAIAGAPVATLSPASGSGEPRVVVCLGESQAAALRAGEAAELRTPVGPPIAGRLERLSPEVSQLPPRCWRDPQLPEWGRAGYVLLDEPTPLLPGQAFSVAFLGEPSPRAGEPPRPAGPSIAVDQPAANKPSFATASEPTSPTEMTVPAMLRSRSRFEPSGIVWSHRLDRFVIVSDDTGLSGQNEHAPWLFTMDVRGRVDPEPLVVAGLDAVNDLESIAPAPDGGFYVLASQSRSRKGKRPAARQRLVHVSLGEQLARGDAVVQLARALDKAGSATLARLGLSDTAELDIEGMTATAAGGLLLGLKAPLGPRGEALIWHLGQPDALLASGDLADGALTLWGQIPLTVTADGARVPGGISELLELADGSLLVAATAAGIDPTTQDGAIVHVTGRAALSTPRTIRVFPGLKPEGLATSGAAIVVVFDAGEATPRWVEVPWPAS